MAAVLGFQCESTNGYEHSLFYPYNSFFHYYFISPAVCILPLVCSLHFTPGLQSAFYTDRKPDRERKTRYYFNCYYLTRDDSWPHLNECFSRTQAGNLSRRSTLLQLNVTKLQRPIWCLFVLKFSWNVWSNFPSFASDKFNVILFWATCSSSKFLIVVSSVPLSLRKPHTDNGSKTLWLWTNLNIH